MAVKAAEIGRFSLNIPLKLGRSFHHKLMYYDLIWICKRIFFVRICRVFNGHHGQTQWLFFSM